MSNYKTLIGLEMHCEISGTKTKVFSSARNGYSEEANTNIRPVDMAFPGTLPVVNKEAIRMAIMMSIILNCKIPEYMYFERKIITILIYQKDFKLLKKQSQFLLVYMVLLIMNVIMR